MEITSTTLDEFGVWLVNRGRSDETARVYQSQLRSCAADSVGITRRLVSNGLAPNTRRSCLAALFAWARFCKDDKLREQLEDIRLPPARRLKAKLPLELDAWRSYIQHLQAVSMTPPNEPLRYVMLIICKRGIRCSDCLRVTRKQVASALRTNVLTFEGKGRKLSRLAAGPIIGELTALAEYKGWERVHDLVSRGSARAALTRVERAMKRVAADLDIDNVHPHRFRTTYATNFLKEFRGDPQALIKLQHHMDWEYLATAARYADAVDASELDAVGATLTGRLTTEKP
jgi:integrase